MIPTATERPRRQAAIAAHENVIAPLATRKKSGMKGRAAPKKVLTAARSNQTDSDDGSSDEDVDLEETTEGETDMDDTSDFGDRSSNKRRKNGQGKMKRVQTGASRRSLGQRKATGAASSKGAASRTKAAQRGKSRKRTLGNREELPINDDNKLFNHVKNPESDLASTAEEWAMYYHDNAGMALAQLVNFFIRSAGCNGTIDENQAEDHDAIASNLSDIQTIYKHSVMPSYPLVSKATAFAKFRRSMGDFIERFFSNALETDMLYDDTFVETFVAWISAMSSSNFRSFRHTAVYVALQSISQLSRIRQDVDAELQSSIKSRDIEKKKTRNDKTRLKELESKVKAMTEAKKSLKEFHGELINTVFVHRYRDSDAGIRVECIEALGSWMKTYPSLQKEKFFFQCIGTLLPDIDPSVRLAAIKAVNGLLGRDAPSQHVRHFVQIQKKRLIDLAIVDVDMSVRIAAINVLLQLDAHELFDDGEREVLASHIFHVEERIRSAVAGFFSRMLDEEVDEQIEEEDIVKIRLKAFASLIIRLSGRVDQVSGNGAEEDQQQQVTANNATALGANSESRITLIVGTLWETIVELHDWKSIIELLLYDHTSKAPATGRKKNKKVADSASSSGDNPPPNEDLRLTSEEEAVLVEALIAVARKVQVLLSASSAATNRDDEEEEAIKALTNMTRATIPAMPKLFAKYRTDAPRITDILLLPLSMNIEVYIETQQTKAYEALWDDISDQFRRHVEPPLLSNAVDSLMAMNQVEALSDINTSRLSEFQEKLVGSLREGVEGRDIESTGFADDELHKLTACSLRAKIVAQRMDMCEALEEDDEGQQTSGWEVLLGLASRGRLGFEAESQMIENALAVLALYILWKTRSIVNVEESTTNEATVAALVTKRNALLDLAADLMDKNASTPVPRGVQREAFAHSLNITTLYSSVLAEGEASDAKDDDTGRTAKAKLRSLLHLDCSDDLQVRFASFIGEEIQLYADETLKKRGSSPSAEDRDGSPSSELDFDEEDNPRPAKRSEKPKATTKETTAEDGVDRRPVQKYLERFLAFIEHISAFVRAIKLGVIDIEHCVEVLAFYGRLGSAFDTCVKLAIDTLREEGILYRRAEETCRIISLVLRRAVSVHQECGANAASETIFVNLSKALSSALVIRGAQLTIQHAIKAEPMVRMHTKVIESALSEADKAASGPSSRSSNGQGSASSNAGKKSNGKYSLVLFKALAQLLVSAGPREAMSIKLMLDKRVKERHAAAQDTGAIKAYEKRLVTIISKDKQLAVGAAIGSKKAPAAPRASLDQMDVDEDEEEDENEIQAPRERPRPIPISASRKRTREEEDEEDEGFQGLDISLSRDGIVHNDNAEDDEEEDEDDASDDESVALSQMEGRMKRAPL